MVLESLFNPFVVKKKPWEMFFAGFLYSVIGLFLSYIVFSEAAGLLTVFLIVIATIPILYTTIKNEEELDLKYDREFILLKEHTKVLFYFMMLFFGITLALVLAYILLPEMMVKSIFSLQEAAILNVNAQVGPNLEVTGNITKLDLFGRIFFNNMKVLFFCIVFSFLYGVGSIFILTWNASVVATAMGNLMKTQLSKSAALIGFNSVSSYLSVAAFSFFRYMVHGFFEILAYFVAGLAGGIISIALIKHNLKEEQVLIDALDLILISVAILLIAGIIEVYITPVLFSSV